MPRLSENAGELTFDGILGLPFWFAALLFAALLIAVMVLLERRRPWRAELGADVDGYFPE
jgi:hypothetical protein